jgi:hypothetical protein
MDVPLAAAMVRTSRLLLAAMWPALALTVASLSAAGARDPVQDVSLRSAFVYNFVKFTEWPALPPGSPIVLCVAGDDAIASALRAIVAGRKVGGRGLEVSQPTAQSAWPSCQLLFLGETPARESSAGLAALKTLPVLTVSGAKGFAQTNGMFELYVESGRMRFAINVTTAERAGLQISSRLLELARIVRTDHAP